VQHTPTKVSRRGGAETEGAGLGQRGEAETEGRGWDSETRLGQRSEVETEGLGWDRRTGLGQRDEVGAEGGILITVDLERCTGCGTCEKDCFSRNIFVRNGKAQVASPLCIHCGHCVAVCPSNAVEIPEYDMADVATLGTTDLSPEELLTFIKARRSIRQYKDKPVDPELVKQIIEAGRYTPTASNRQELTFIVIEKELLAFRSLVAENLAELGRAMLASEGTSELLSNYARRWLEIEKVYREDPKQKDALFLGAPLVILVAGDHPVDAGLAASNMELVACANRLGVLYSGFITRGATGEKIKTAVGIPPGKEVLVSLLVGYPAVKYQRTAPRKKADVVWN